MVSSNRCAKHYFKQKYMKKIFSCFIIATLLAQSVIVFADDAPMEAGSGKFIVTAYYSPLPNQSYYLK
jgi:hypothetical protein